MNNSKMNQDYSMENIKNEYDKKNFIKCFFIFISLLVLVFCILFSVTIGSADISIGEVKDVILSTIFGNLKSSDQNSLQKKIVILLRMPRVILAVLAGAGLSVSGVIMQAITQNPLVSPFTIGISSAAVFGASLSIVLGIGFYAGTMGGIVLNAFIFSLLCALLVYGISNKVGMTPESLILTGISINYLFSALSATMQFFSKEHQLAAVVQWTFGSVNGATWTQVALVSVVLAVSFPILYYYSWIFNAMSSSGDEVAKGFGIKPSKVRAITGIITVFVTSAIISFTGVIGFIGLVGPHIARLAVGSDHRFLIPYSAIFGAILLLISDTIGRTILSPVIIPVGIVISFLGVPLFINLILTKRKEHF
ncbi:iron ABC transporter permease [uncultured Clostridium sp.]|uniref:FecCD family ABC transporter permease n=1 Tax=uncultured Clostridium sp. TaxID=59620 RepID=UPI0028E4002F|nr:iron ABC transporter permease [uncultured Clostridium sp.]